ncbi:MAG: hypothetical protein GXO79_02415 [Chlorobi bacterium]|nr:hypothetical protein [Chlorobiota bacterium]
MKIKLIKVLFVSILTLYSCFLNSQTTYMLKDFSQTTESSNPAYFITNNNLTYFIADDGIHGTELWKTKGTVETTELVYDIYEGNESGINNDKGQKVFIDSILYFVGDDLYQGKEIWRTDGTNEGTYRVKWSLSSIINLQAFKSELLYISGHKLWLSTNNVTEFNAIDNNITTYGSIPAMHLLVVGDTLYFVGWDETHGYELWLSDGTPESTKLVKDINTGSESSFENGPISPPFVALNNILYFVCKTQEYGREIWRSDGTEEGTYILKDINPGTKNGFEMYNVADYYKSFYLYNKKIYFAANDGQHGGELWVTDGTEAGTYMVKDISQNGSSNPYNFIGFNNELFFKINYGTNLWKTDGTSANTKLIIQGNYFKDFSIIRATSNNLYFTKKYDNSELWRMDKDYDCYKIGNFNYIKTFQPTDNSLYFSFNDSIIGYELWNINDSTNDYHLVDDINKNGNSHLGELTVLNNSLFFTSKNNLHETKLWVSNGMDKYTKSIMSTEYISDFPKNLIIYKNMVFFTDNNSSIYHGLFKTNGTKESTKIVKEFDNQIKSLEIYDDYLYIENNTGIWRSDGTEKNTSLIPMTNSFTHNSFFVYKNGLFLTYYSTLYYLDTLNNNLSEALYSFDSFDFNPFIFNGKFFFYAEKINMNTFPETYYNGFWVSDGTKEGTYLSLSFKALDDFIIYKDHLIISGMIEDENFGLFKSDGTSKGTLKIEDLSFNRLINQLTIFNDTLYYTKSDLYFSNVELYKTNTVINNSILVKDIFINGNDEISNLFATDSLLFFSANDGVHGIEPWQTKGTENSTIMISDINKSGSSNPSNYTLMNNNLYYIANDGVHGRELWATIYQPIFKLQADSKIIFGEVSNNQPILQLNYIIIPDTGTIAFKILSGNFEKAFKIDNERVIRVSNEQYLNQFEFNRYNLTIEMNNGTKTDTATFIIQTSLYNFYNDNYPEKVLTEYTDDEIMVYPNPCFKSFSIISEIMLIYKIEIISLKGDVVYSQMFKKGILEKSIALHNKKGVLICRIFLKDKVINKKIIFAEY